MRRSYLLVVPLVLVLSHPAVGQQQPGRGAVRSPEVLADGRVTFRVAAPKAADVRLTCECTDGPQALTRDANGLWSITVGPIAPDVYEYEFSVDGVQMPDPRNEKLKYNSRPGPASSLLDVAGNAPRFFDARQVPHGTVEIRWYPSKAANALRRMHVYTPPNYERGNGRLPVLYLLHGADGDDSVWTSFGRVNVILDNLIAEGKASPMVVVMPFGYAHPPTGGVSAAQQRADFETDLLQDIMPFVHTNYRVQTDRSGRALVGLSMGGGQALNIGLRHLNTFSRVGGFSAAVPRNTSDGALKEVLADPKKVNSSLKLLWIGCGSEDGLFAANKAFSDTLKASGITHTFHPTSGAHTWIVWRRYLRDLAPQVFPRS